MFDLRSAHKQGAVCYSVLQVRCSVLQCVASLLQCAAVCCKCVAVCCSVLQVCCSVLQCVVAGLKLAGSVSCLTFAHKQGAVCCSV